jgi:hypothetical protein
MNAKVQSKDAKAQRKTDKTGQARKSVERLKKRFNPVLRLFPLRLCALPYTLCVKSLFMPPCFNMKGIINVAKN